MILIQENAFENMQGISAWILAFNVIQVLVELYVYQNKWFGKQEDVSFHDFDVQRIGAETKWPPFSRQHFQMDFLEWKCLNSD